ncbi:hypothetical protein DPMN_146415 [Dreissena polymorpha]|uniref:WWE domain-containing protein n=1 Tax=Dreissena polymorpha TaxID=45954 RepID=A0A9D4F7V1_DREPO|nr:hypothetical protein DPMN_146415 [Dreissena polymorpha]
MIKGCIRRRRSSDDSDDFDMVDLTTMEELSSVWTTDSMDLGQYSPPAPVSIGPLRWYWQDSDDTWIPFEPVCVLHL